MTQIESSRSLFVGIDVAATTAAAAWIGTTGRVSKAISVDQTAEGWTALRAHLSTTGVPADQTLVVMEATGSYWIGMATHLVEHGYGVSVINPAQAHNFAKALLKRPKTDAIDAQTLARLASTLKPTLWAPPPAVYHELKQRLAERDRLLAMRQQLRNQRHALDQHVVIVAAVRDRMDQLIVTIDEHLLQVEGELTRVLKQDATWAATAKRLQSIPGVGALTAAWLLVTTLNFSLCPSPEAATAYAGLAPHAWMSGSSVNRPARIGHSGNTRLRQALYMATLSATTWNPAVKALYDRLRDAGKPHKVARCAAARKLLHQAWAIGTKGTVFRPDYAASPRSEGQAPPTD